MKSRYVVVIILAIAVVVFGFIFRKDLFANPRFMHESEPIPFVEGRYEEYSEEKLKLSETKQIILFFNASWCPSCNMLDNELATFVEELPPSVLILSVDFDANQKLRQKYKVPFQHTFIILGDEGEEIRRWSGGGIERFREEFSTESHI